MFLFWFLLFVVVIVVDNAVVVIIVITRWQFFVSLDFLSLSLSLSLLLMFVWLFKSERERERERKSERAKNEFYRLIIDFYCWFWSLLIIMWYSLFYEFHPPPSYLILLTLYWAHIEHNINTFQVLISASKCFKKEHWTLYKYYFFLFFSFSLCLTYPFLIILHSASM